ncbi:MAG: transposase [Candidatus Paceibacterota bacterium]
MRNTQFAEGEFYHLVGRGNSKQILFLEKRDYVRFLYLLLYGQLSEPLSNIGKRVTCFEKTGAFFSRRRKNDLAQEKHLIELVAFTIMPNHFHLLVGGKSENGISAYMHRLLMAYAKYFNEKYERSGHVFQGPFRAVHIEDNTQLLHTSAYIHKNQREVGKWKNKEHEYPWSSYQDYVKGSRWEELLSRDIILEQFSSVGEYANFVKSSIAKEASP